MNLLFWAIVFFVISIIAAAFGFTGVASGARTIAKVLFGIFLVIALVLLVLAITGVAVVGAAAS